MRDRCQFFRDTILHREYATAEDIAPYWPGGAENPESARSVGGWIYCYGMLSRMLERGELREGGGGAAPRPDIDDGAVMAALHDEPQPVRLHDGRVVRVYPKSWATLHHMRAVQAASDWVLTALARIEAGGDAESVAALPVIVEASAALTRRLVWIATQPGAGLPYDIPSAPTAMEPDDARGVAADDDGAPLLRRPSGLFRRLSQWWQRRRVARLQIAGVRAAPRWINALHPADLFAVLHAFHQVNYARMSVLAAYLGQHDTDGQRPRWAEFFVGAQEPTRLELEALIGERSVVSILARVAIAADTPRRAAAEAKAQAGHREDAANASAFARDALAGTEVARG